MRARACRPMTSPGRARRRSPRRRRVDHEEHATGAGRPRAAVWRARRSERSRALLTVGRHPRSSSTAREVRATRRGAASWAPHLFTLCCPRPSMLMSTERSFLRNGRFISSIRLLSFPFFESGLSFSRANLRRDAFSVETERRSGERGRASRERRRRGGGDGDGDGARSSARTGAQNEATVSILHDANGGDACSGRRKCSSSSSSSSSHAWRCNEKKRRRNPPRRVASLVGTTRRRNSIPRDDATRRIAPQEGDHSRAPREGTYSVISLSPAHAHTSRSLAPQHHGTATSSTARAAGRAAKLKPRCSGMRTRVPWLSCGWRRPAVSTHLSSSSRAGGVDDDVGRVRRARRGVTTDDTSRS